MASSGDRVEHVVPASAKVQHTLLNVTSQKPQNNNNNNKSTVSTLICFHWETAICFSPAYTLICHHWETSPENAAYPLITTQWKTASQVTTTLLHWCSSLISSGSGYGSVHCRDHFWPFFSFLFIFFFFDLGERNANIKKNLLKKNCVVLQSLFQIFKNWLKRFSALTACVRGSPL